MGDLRTTEGEGNPATHTEKRRSRRRWVVGITVLFLGAGAAGWFVRVDRYVPATGYVTTREYAEVRPAATGQVAEILVGSGDQVTAGQVLVRLDSASQEAALAEAHSQMEELQAELERRRAEVAEIRRQLAADIAEAELRLEDSRRTVERITAALAGDGAAESSAELAGLQAARDAVRKARAQLERRRAEIAEDRRNLDWDRRKAGLLLENATSEAERTAAMVEEKLAPASRLEAARLQEKLAGVNLEALENRDPTVWDKELAVLEEELRTRETAAAQAEAALRQRLQQAQLQQQLADLALRRHRERDPGVLDKDLVVVEKRLGGARADVQRCQAELAARAILAPIAGTALRYEFVIGELVRPDSVLYDIFGGTEKVLKLRVGERYATKVAADQTVAARLAPYRGLRDIWFEGKVQALRNVIQTEGKISYRVAYCSFDDQGYAVPPGTTAEARIYYGRSPIWLYIFAID